MKIAARAGVTAASAPLWMHGVSREAFGQGTSSYKAIVVVTLNGGNDGNNMIVPLDNARYSQYASLRPSLAIPQGSLIPLLGQSGGVNYGLHPSLVNVASLYNRGKALAVANVGPLSAPATKTQIAANPDLLPQALMSHASGVAQWESASSLALPATGWGGRLADLLSSQSGALPPVLDAGPESIFTVGNTVQAIAVPTGSSNLVPLPAGLDAAILAIAQNDSNSSNKLVAQAAQLRVQASRQQALIVQAQQAGAGLSTVFPQTVFGQSLSAVASLINGRSVIGASRQIFYLQQAGYDTHGAQAGTHAGLLSDFDGGIGAFMTALQEMGLQNQVLVCTHSDFNRSLLGNGSGGSDHAWGNHQFMFGGGIRGGQIIGSIPDPELGGSLDITGTGIWIPTLSVTQMTAGVGSWMGLNNAQLGTVFPDLANFSQGPISIV